jgi:hypothetical protein
MMRKKPGVSIESARMRTDAAAARVARTQRAGTAAKLTHTTKSITQRTEIVERLLPSYDQRLVHERLRRVWQSSPVQPGFLFVGAAAATAATMSVCE